MSREKKVKIFLVAVAVLYVLVTVYGVFGRGDGKMGAAMAVVDEEVAAARAAIRKEMEKPFILRLFGSLFGMEGNSLEKLKTSLPPVLKDAMPSMLARRTRKPPAAGLACLGMRLPDALAYLAQNEEARLEEVLWDWDSRVQEERYVKLGGTVLEAKANEHGGVRLVIQFPHAYGGEEGLGSSAAERRQHLDEIEAAVRRARQKRLWLFDWLVREDPRQIDQAVEKGFDVVRWCGADVPSRAHDAPPGQAPAAR